MGGKIGFKLFVDPEAGCGVGDLTEEGGTEPRIEAEKPIAFYDMTKGSYHRFGCVATTGLEPYLKEFSEVLVSSVDYLP